MIEEKNVPPATRVDFLTALKNPAEAGTLNAVCETVSFHLERVSGQCAPGGAWYIFYSCDSINIWHLRRPEAMRRVYTCGAAECRRRMDASIRRLTSQKESLIERI